MGPQENMRDVSNYMYKGKKGNKLWIPFQDLPGSVAKSKAQIILATVSGDDDCVGLPCPAHLPLRLLSMRNRALCPETDNMHTWQDMVPSSPSTSSISLDLVNAFRAN